MKSETIIAAATLVALLALSAFFSAAETALFSISDTQRRQLKKSRKKTDRLLTRLLSDPARMITTILVGNNIVNVWAASIATAFAIGVFGQDGVGIATAAMTVIIIVFSEITPKNLAAANPIRLARKLARPISFARTILYPLVRVFSCVNSFFLRITRWVIHEPENRLTEDEIKTMMDVGKETGILAEEEHGLLNRAFDFTDLTIREIMTPRTDIVALPADAEIDDIVETFQKHRFSRIPVYESSVDDIQGMIHYKDFLFMSESEKRHDTKNLIRAVIFVPESKTTAELLKEMERENQNLAIVIDEYGATAGLVTIDDVIAAVFGGIHDEYDTGSPEPTELVRFLDDGHLSVPGNLKISELNTLIGTNLDSGQYETVGGLVLELADRLPARGERFCLGGVEFHIAEISGRRIQKIDIRLTV